MSGLKEGSSIPWNGWAYPRRDQSKSPDRRQRLANLLWKHVGSTQQDSQPAAEWMDLDELLKGSG